MKSLIRFLAVFSIFLTAQLVLAQTTAFSYQGRLTDGGNPANGSFQMQFKLYDDVSGGIQQGATLVDVPVTVTAGGFSVKLDFGASVFTGENRWLEVSVRRNSGESYTILAPREQIASSPHSIKSKNAATSDALSANCTNCVTSGQILSVDGAQITGVLPTISIPSDSENYIQNASVPRGDRKVLGQPAASLNIGGNATVGSMDVNGPVSLAAISAPAAAAGKARIYFDTATNKVKVSENGGTFVNLVGATGVIGSGTVNKLPLFSAATTLGDSVIAQSGTNIGLGTTTPNTRLTLSGGAPWTNLGWTASMNLQNASALGWEANASGQRFGIGQSTGGLYFFRSNSAFGNTASPANYDMGITDTGNVGIGTGLPNSKLEVRGASVHQRITDTASGNSLVLQGGAGNNMKVTGYNYGTGAAVPLYLSVDGANTILNTGGGTVGVGTSNPHTGYRMDIFGGTRVHSDSAAHFVAETTGGTNSWARFYMRSPSRSWLMGTSQNFNGNQLYIADETAGQTRLSIDTAGKVSLGVLQITGGSDLAENFAMADASEIKPGMVVAIDPKNAGKLVLARGAYNRRVAGIISGANNLAAGMLLPDLKEGENSMPVALSGRVWVYADASSSPIRPGDLLTTSTTKAGFAMKVANYRRAQGAIIGKAMTELKSGTGLVLVLVTLQ